MLRKVARLKPVAMLFICLLIHARPSPRRFNFKFTLNIGLPLHITRSLSSSPRVQDRCDAGNARASDEALLVQLLDSKLESQCCPNPRRRPEGHRSGIKTAHVGD